MPCLRLTGARTCSTGDAGVSSWVPSAWAFVDVWMDGVAEVTASRTQRSPVQAPDFCKLLHAARVHTGHWLPLWPAGTASLRAATVPMRRGCRKESCCCSRVGHIHVCVSITEQNSLHERRAVGRLRVRVLLEDVVSCHAFVHTHTVSHKITATQQAEPQLQIILSILCFISLPLAVFTTNFQL